MSICVRTEKYRVVLSIDYIHEMSFHTTIHLSDMESVTKGIVEVEFMGGLCMNITLHQFELYMQWYLSIARLDMTEDDLCLKFGNWTVIPHGIFYGHPTIKPCRDFTIVRNERGDILVVVWIDGQREPFHISQITGLIAMSMTMDDSVLY